MDDIDVGDHPRDAAPQNGLAAEADVAHRLSDDGSEQDLRHACPCQQTSTPGDASSLAAHAHHNRAEAIQTGALPAPP